MTLVPSHTCSQWEKQLGRVQGRVGPLHIAICQKKYDTVRAVLDLGADPNLSGVQYVDDYGKNLRARAKVYASKKADARSMKDMVGASDQPMRVLHASKYLTSACMDYEEPLCYIKAMAAAILCSCWQLVRQ